MTASNSISTALDALLDFGRPKKIDRVEDKDAGSDKVYGPQYQAPDDQSSYELDVSKVSFESLDDLVKRLEDSGKLDLSPDGVRSLAYNVRDQLRDLTFGIANARPDLIQGLLRL
ncbi:MAG: hypothetical protein FJX52_05640 [Alphaproteobacteria bacterium]|nr:hypothetical protein [Alphaproteobacteria bacterium]